MKVVFAAFMLVAGVAQAATVQVPLGANIQSLVNANPPGTVFEIPAGTFRHQQITPKDGMVFRGMQPGSVYLVGSKRLQTWTKDGSRWYAVNQTQQGELHPAPECKDDFPRCAYPDDVFYAGVPLKHVTSRLAVVPGTFFFDYATDRIYIGDNPAGKVIEAAVTPWAFGGTASDVTIEGLNVFHYATPTQEGVIRGPGVGWVLRNNRIARNHSIGVDAGPAWLVSGNVLSYNGMAGYAGGGDDIVFEDNIIAFNNYAGVNAFWEGGAGKITESNRPIVRNNCVHSNGGPGIWFDESADNVITEGNRVFNNEQAGIFFEISTGATIRNNVVFNNGTDTSRGWFWEPQILVSSADNAIVENNVVDVAAAYGNGLTIISQNRLPWTPATGNIIRNNVVTLRGLDARMGAVTDVGADQSAVANGNTMVGNIYHVTSIVQDHWNWNNTWRTLPQMQSIGQELGSTIDTTMPAAPAAVCQ